MMRELLAGVGVGRESTWGHPEVKAKPEEVTTVVKWMLTQQ